MKNVRYFAQRERFDSDCTSLQAVWKAVFGVVAISAALSLGACSSKKSSESLFAGTGSPRLASSTKAVPKGGGRHHIGKPYKINGKKYYPKDVSSYERTGKASWYGPKFHRRKTSNGEWFDMHDLTAAHTTLPLPSYVKVTNLANGKQAVVRVNDRGPFAHNRIIDLSKRTSEILDFKGKGTANVKVVYLGKAPLKHDGTHLAAMNKKHLRSSDYARVASAMNYSSRPTQYAEAQQPAVQSDIIEPAGAYFVQAASFSSPDNARRAKIHLADVGPVNIFPIDTGANTFYRVTVGPLSSPEHAERTLSEVAQKGMLDARIVTQ